MTTKIRIKIDGVEVDYEGPEAFLDKKLCKLISDVSTLAKQAPVGSGASNLRENTERRTSSTLASFLKEKKANSHNDRFLATAQWLHEKGLELIKTNDVTKALQDSKQKKLSNASECLNRNVHKGYCEKMGKGFFVTDEGREALDLQ